jgi:hypothetical protein
MFVRVLESIIGGWICPYRYRRPRSPREAARTGVATLGPEFGSRGVSHHLDYLQTPSAPCALFVIPK